MKITVTAGYVSLLLMYTTFAHFASADRIFTTAEERKQLNTKRYNSEVKTFTNTGHTTTRTTSKRVAKLNGFISHNGRNAAVWLNGSRSDSQQNIAIEADSTPRKINVYFIDRNVNTSLKPGQVYEFSTGKDSDFFEYQSSDANAQASSKNITKGTHQTADITTDRQGERVAQSIP